MATIDINQYIEQSGMRKARFGGYEPDDVRQAMLDLCSNYEQRLNTALQQARGAQQEAEALRRRCQTLIGQNQNLAAQNANLAGKADRIARMQSDMETRYSKVQERNHSLTDQVAVLRLKNSDLTLKNKELTERAENSDAALRIKGREAEQAKQQVLSERDQVVAAAQKEAAKIRSQARDEADQLLKDTNLKAEAIDQLAREQAIGQARKMVQAATEETREIQNAHRLRLQDLQSRITAMEQQRDKLMDFLAKMIGELQETQDYARQNSPLPQQDTEPTEPAAEPQLDLSPTAVDAAASALRTENEEGTTPAAPAAPEEEPAQPRNCVVAPGWNNHANDTRVARPVPDGPEKQPQAEYFDTTPTANELHTLQAPPADAAPAGQQEEVEIPGAIFSYPILRQKGEPILDEEPPVRGPHTPLLPDVDADDEDEETPAPMSSPAQQPSAQPAPAQANAPAAPGKITASGPRRKKAVMALRALRRRLGEV